jgi:uncharacterized phage protein (TIGR01671 family)
MKLRFFDHKTNKMYKILNICFEGTPTVTIQYNPVVKTRAEFDCIMLSSGMFDKNDIEIFDKDIVKWGDDYYLVNYEKGCFWLTNNLFDIPLSVESHTNIYGEDMYYQSRDISFALEIVGNKYENVDLFQKSNR